MKKLIWFTISFILVTYGCGPQTLSRSDAEKIMRSTMQLPLTRELTIFMDDPLHKNIPVFEKEGLIVLVQHDGKPIITFTEKAKPYLLDSSDEHSPVPLQKVKLGEEDIQEITGIQLHNEGRAATVEYTTVLTNLTPFAVILPEEARVVKSRTASFTLYDDGWRLLKE